VAGYTVPIGKTYKIEYGCVVAVMKM